MQQVGLLTQDGAEAGAATAAGAQPATAATAAAISAARRTETLMCFQPFNKTVRPTEPDMPIACPPSKTAEAAVR